MPLEVVSETQVYHISFFKVLLASFRYRRHLTTCESFELNYGQDEYCCEEKLFHFLMKYKNILLNIKEIFNFTLIIYEPVEINFDLNSKSIY